jgi:histidine triad (HIT) family protein
VADCPFCEIVAGRAPAEVVWDYPDAMGIIPLNPVVNGHLIFFPKVHVADFAEDAEVSAATMLRVAQSVRGWVDCNVITSRGRAATQSVMHLHLHLVPRVENDGLALPWYSGRGGKLATT